MKKQKIMILAAAAAAAAALLLLGNRGLVRLIWHNLYSPEEKLDTAADWDGGKIWERLSYSEVSESDYLDLYVPEAESPMPLLILVHGGGFVSNDSQSRQAQFMYRYFRDHGYACASVNYRLAQEAGYPAAIEDVKAAVRFLKANAKTYGYDPERFAVWGESAGGYLAAMAALTGDADFCGVKFTGEEELAKPVSGQVSALLDYYGIIDMDLTEEDYEKEGIPKWLRAVSAIPLNRNLEGYENVEDMWVGRDVDACSKEEREQMSARSYLTDQSEIKVLIYHGDSDLSVALTQSERLAKECASVLGSDRVTFRVFEGYRHAADSFYAQEQMEAAETFLDQVFGESDQIG